jgi:signal transduction protein with GAF and PtsI domain
MVAARFNAKGTTFMKPTTTWKPRKKAALVVARASGATWVVAWSRRVIPGALFKTREAALNYAAILARAAGLGAPDVMVLA